MSNDRVIRSVILEDVGSLCFINFNGMNRCERNRPGHPKRYAAVGGNRRKMNYGVGSLAISGTEIKPSALCLFQRMNPTVSALLAKGERRASSIAMRHSSYMFLSDTVGSAGYMPVERNVLHSSRKDAAVE